MWLFRGSSFTCFSWLSSPLLPPPHPSLCAPWNLPTNKPLTLECLCQGPLLGEPKTRHSTSAMPILPLSSYGNLSHPSRPSQKDTSSEKPRWCPVRNNALSRPPTFSSVWHMRFFLCHSQMFELFLPMLAELSMSTQVSLRACHIAGLWKPLPIT